MYFWSVRERYTRDIEEDAPIIESLETHLMKRVRTGVLVMAIALTVEVLVPVKGTVLMIAASEMGEEVIESSTGSLAHEALNKYLEGFIESKEVNTEW